MSTAAANPEGTKPEGCATARAQVNIALVKYWGKRDVALNLPAAGSLSITLEGLSTSTLSTITTVRFLPVETRDRLLLGGREAAPAALTKALRVVDAIRARARLCAAVEIVSENDFPTGAGLASSASGLAALTVAAADAAGLALSPRELSGIARLGSGSASRSLFGGFARWDAGVAPDGSDSVAHALFPREHWDLRVVVALVSRAEKKQSSTDGMTHTARTSPYHAAFVAHVDADIEAAELAVAARDIAALGRVAERSCLRMHADMLAADPPLCYLQPGSWEVIAAVRALQAAGVPAFFTADAGPNVKVFCTVEALPAVRKALSSIASLEGTIEARPGGAARLLDGGGR